MTITGTIIHVGEVQTFKTKSGSDFTKQEVVLRTDGDYPQEVLVEVTGKALDHVPAVDTKATAHIDIRGRSYEKDGNKRWFNSITCWRWETGEPAAATDHRESFQDVPF